MNKQTMLGGSLLAVALVLMIYDLGDTISDLQNWHGLTTPAVIGVCLKKFANIAIAALGGGLMPSPGAKEPLTVDLSKLGQP